MTISRRSLLQAGVATGTALSFPSVLRSQTTLASTQAVRMVKSGDLGVFDPMISSYYITADHGSAIYDTLFALDSRMTPQPQMVGNWGVPMTRKRIRSYFATAWAGTTVRLSLLATVSLQSAAGSRWRLAGS